jgi:hypothetical protein
LIAQRHQCGNPSRPISQHPLGRPARIERCAINHDAEGIDELRAGQQRAGIDVGFDSVNLHGLSCPHI